MTETTQLRAVGFIRTLANHCPCVYKSEDRCRDCYFGIAKTIIKDIDREAACATPEIDYSYYARQKMIVEILAKAAKPLLANEINLGGICSMQLKYWTLQNMIRKGRLGRKFAYAKNERKYFRYYLKQQKETK